MINFSANGKGLYVHKSKIPQVNTAYKNQLTQMPEDQFKRILPLADSDNYVILELPESERASDFQVAGNLRRTNEDLKSVLAVSKCNYFQGFSHAPD